MDGHLSRYYCKLGIQTLQDTKTAIYNFPPFCLDLKAGQLLEGEDPVGLRPKTHAVLTCLVAQHGELVSKEQLLQQVWGNVVVEDGALKNCIRELRSALHDTPRNSRYIQTVHGRGYRFIKPVTVDAAVEQSTTAADLTAPTDLMDATGDGFVGREEPLQKMLQLASEAAQGSRRLLFVTGEAGIGKSSLIDAFLPLLKQHSRAHDSVPLSYQHGQCIEQYGTAEPYMPVIQAVSALAQGERATQVLDCLERYAPSWVDRLSTHGQGLARTKRQSNQEGMLLELVEAIEGIAAEQLLVVHLEDLQWCDLATIELLNILSRRKGFARLLVVATYRQEDVLKSGHPLPAMKQELLMHRLCSEIQLRTLSTADVQHYLDSRFTPNHFVDRYPDLAAHIHARTDGNPLFMSEIVQHLQASNGLDWQHDQWVVTDTLEAALQEIPTELRQFIDLQVSRLGNATQQVLEVASLAGMEFSARLLAGFVDTAEAAIDNLCIELAEQGHILEYVGEKILEDGRVIQRYGFIHELHQQTLEKRLPPAQRVTLYRQIAEFTETLFKDDLDAVSAELAYLYERGRHYARAVHYLHCSAQRAKRLGGYRDAHNHLIKGLELVGRVNDVGQRKRLEVALHASLGLTYVATKGWASAEAFMALTRARELSEELREKTYIFPVLYGLGGYYNGRAEFAKTLQLCQEIITRATDVGDKSHLLEGYVGQGAAHTWLGHPREAIAYFNRALTLCAEGIHRSHIYSYGHDPYCAALSMRAIALLLDEQGGEHIEAEHTLKAAQQEATRLDHHYTLTYVNTFAAIFYQLQGEYQKTLSAAQAGEALSQKYNLSGWLAENRILKGWAQAHLSEAHRGVALMQQGMTELEQLQSRWGDAYYPLLLAEGLRRLGDDDQALQLQEKAVAFSKQVGGSFYKVDV